MTSFTRKDLVASLARKHQLTARDAERMLLDVFADLTDALSQGKIVTMHPFGTFSVTRRAPRKGRHPRTGATIRIPERNDVVFKPHAGVKKAVA